METGYVLHETQFFFYLAVYTVIIMYVWGFILRVESLYFQATTYPVSSSLMHFVSTGLRPFHGNGVGCCIRRPSSVMFQQTLQYLNSIFPAACGLEERKPIPVPNDLSVSESNQ